MQRKTFEQTARDILADARLGSIVCGDVPVTAYNWVESADEVVNQTNQAVERLVADLAMVTGRNIVLGKKFAPNRWVGNDGHLKMRASYTWDNILKAYPHFVNGTINNLNYNHHHEFAAFPLHPLKWSKGVAHTYFPDEASVNRQISLDSPEEYSGNDLPAHFRAKLDLLKHTHYDLQPYVLRDGVGPNMLLCLRLGCQWRDIVIASHHLPAPKKLNIAMILAIFLCLSVCFGGWYAGLYMEGGWMKWVVTIVAGLSGAFGTLLASTFITRKFKPLKV